MIHDLLSMYGNCVSLHEFASLEQVSSMVFFKALNGTGVASADKIGVLLCCISDGGSRGLQRVGSGIRLVATLLLVIWLRYKGKAESIVSRYCVSFVL